LILFIFQRITTYPNIYFPQTMGGLREEKKTGAFTKTEQI
jgi:hypothetical protein